jgi:Na+/H+ antiporter NhaA
VFPVGRCRLPRLGVARLTVHGLDPEARGNAQTMPSESRPAASLEGRTAWGRSVEAPLRDFLRTETGSAAVLLGATLAALAWVNIDAASYQHFWHTTLSLRVGGAGLSQDLRHWVNNGLMTFFFLVIGLEARREFDVGELRQRSRAMLPLVAGLGGMAVPVLIYLAFNSGLESQHGWGTAMSTDTAFALGMLALVGARRLDRLRAFLLTVVVIDDVVALAVIALAYTEHVAVGALLAAAGLFAVVLVVRALHVHGGWLYFALGLAIWVALLESGVEPVVVGLAMGLLTYAYPAARSDLETATERFRSFREQPTPELARTAQAGVQSAISPNDRLQHLFHPWTSYVIVPLFALANAGIVVSSDFLRSAFTSPITLGILVGYVAGKPAGVIGASTLVSLFSRGRLRPLVGWAAVVGSGTIAGIGFTVSILIATLAFEGRQLEEAKLGVLVGALVAAALTWVVFRVTALLPKRMRARALLGTSRAIVDLVPPVDAGRDHVRGPLDAQVTLVEYGDFECPYCGLAEGPIRELLADSGDVRYVWRHLPLNDVHPRAQLAAEAAEAAAAQDAFWEMHDVLLSHQRALGLSDLALYAEDLSLDVDRFVHDLQRHHGASRIAEDVASADSSGVSGTPSFFVNGRRHEGAYDIAALRAAAKTARVRATISGAGPSPRGPAT